jgi:Bacterial Ig-like domain/WD40-like Beta Propeller Repeat
VAVEAPGGRVRRVAIRSILVLVVGAAILTPILYYASTVDVRPPQVDHFAVTQHLPGDGSVALTTASLEIGFSEDVDHTTAQTAFAIDPHVTGAFSWSGTTMVFTPSASLPLETSFSVTVGSGVRDLAGNVMGASGPYTFRTVGSPSVVATSPEGSATDVPLNATITLSFSTLMDTASVANALEIIPRTDVDLRWSGQKVTIVPRQPLQPDHPYLLLVGTSATDLAGTALSNPLSLSFSTVPAGLHARAVLPQDTAQGIAVTTSIAVVLDRAIDPGSVRDRLISVVPAVAGSLSLVAPDGAAGMTDTARRILRFVPSGPLPANTTFTVTLDPGLRGTDGAQLAAPLTWTFTTGSPSASLANQIVFLSSRSGVPNLWAMNPDGSNQHQVSAELSPVTTYAVAPDGRSYVTGDGARLIEEQADGSQRRILTQSDDLEFDPSYAPDGSAIVFGRADAATGAGLGLWSRPPSGGPATAITVPSGDGGVAATPQATPSAAQPSATEPAPVLRAPRYSPDGTQIAFVDTGGRVGILDLGDGSLTAAAFHAASPPAWFPDSEGIVVSGLGSVSNQAPWASGLLTPGTPVPPLTPAGLRLTGAEEAGLRTVELDAGLSLAQTTPLNEGAALPVVGANGRIAYVVLGPDSNDAGSLWIAAPGGLGSVELSPDTRARARGVSFAPESGTLVVAREAVIAPEPEPPPGASASPAETSTPTPTPRPTLEARPAGGIWLIDAQSGIGRQLTTDGWLARWLP